METVVKPLVALLAFAMVVSPAGLLWAQSLTPFEEAAISERLPSATEQADRDKNCRLSGAKIGQIKLTDDLEAEVHSIEAMRFLMLFHYVKGASEEEIRMFPKLPNGGIGAMHLCTSTELETPKFRKSDSVANTKVIAMRLSKSLDPERQYPASAPLIAERGQIFEIPALTYALIPTANRDAAEAILLESRKSDRVDQDGAVIFFKSSILIPLKPE